ncbi:unnamed protein product [Schistosoma spindalis]|nr:unnamed protein product [Schistosoma spindale]
MTTLKLYLTNKEQIECDRINLQSDKTSVIYKSEYKYNNNIYCPNNDNNNNSDNNVFNKTINKEHQLINLPVPSSTSIELATINNIDYINQRNWNKYKQLNNLQKLFIFCIPFYYLIDLYLNIYNKFCILSKYKKWNNNSYYYLFIKLNNNLLKIFYNYLFKLTIIIIITIMIIIIYYLFINILNYNLYISILFSIYIIIFLIFNFSLDIQCITFMILSYLTTSYIRWLLLMYATYIIIFELILNILYHFEIIKCLFNYITYLNVINLNKLNDFLLNVLKISIENLINEYNSMLYNIRNTLFNIHLFTLKLITIINNNNIWIKSIYNSCKNTDEVYNLCRNFFNKAYILCNNELDIPNNSCDYIIFYKNNICNAIQISTNECDNYNQMILYHLNITLKKNLNNKIENILNTIGHDNITTTIMNFNESKQMIHKMDNEIIDLKQINSFINYIEETKLFILWFLFLWALVTMIKLFIKAIVFRNLWLSQITFENSYITSEYIQQEKQAILQGIPSTFPLTHNESKHYKLLTSFSWSHNEKNKMKCSNTLFNVWIVLIIIIILLIQIIHNSLLSLTSLISNDFIQPRTRYSHNDDNLNFSSEIFNKIPYQSIIVSGTFYENIVRNILDLLIHSKDTIINNDVTVCHPISSSQDFNDNIIVITLLVLTIISQLIEVYIMRLRHIIMIWYYPERSNQRASWLRAHIRNNRKLFNDFKYTSGDTTDKHGCCFTNNPKIKHVLAGFSIKRITCFWCNKESYPSKKQKPIENASQYSGNVHGCSICQLDLGNICIKCRTLLSLKYSQIGLEHLNNEEYTTMNSVYSRRDDQY